MGEKVLESAMRPGFIGDVSFAQDQAFGWKMAIEEKPSHFRIFEIISGRKGVLGRVRGYDCCVLDN
jgi:hypothetical protein